MESGVYAVDWDIRVLWNGGMTPGVPLNLQVEISSLVVRWERRDSFPGEAVKWTLISRRGGKKGAFLELFQDPWYSSSGDGNVGELFELPQGCQGPFRGSRGKMELISRPHSRKGPHLALKREYPGFPKVAAGNVGFHWSFDRDLKQPLMLPQEFSVSMRFANVLSG